VGAKDVKDWEDGVGGAAGLCSGWCESVGRGEGRTGTRELWWGLGGVQGYGGTGKRESGSGWVEFKDVEDWEEGVGAGWVEFRDVEDWEEGVCGGAGIPLSRKAGEG